MLILYGGTCGVGRHETQTVKNLENGLQEPKDNNNSTLVGA